MKTYAFWTLALALALGFNANSQDHGHHDHHNHPHAEPAKGDQHHPQGDAHAGHPTHVDPHAHPVEAHNNHEHPTLGCDAAAHTYTYGAHAHHETAYNPTPAVIHHISDANEFHVIGDFTIPLPCILYSNEGGLSMFSSSKFHHGGSAYNGYAIVGGDVFKIKNFPVQSGEAHLTKIINCPDDHGHGDCFACTDTVAQHGFVVYECQVYELESASSLLSFTSFIDFSITKNVMTMLMAGLFLIFIMIGVAKRYKTGVHAAPTGFWQRLIEPLVVFLRDDVIKPSVGEKYERYMPFLLTLFFFILTCNIFGLVPFFPFSSNVTGNLSVTLVLAFMVFFVVNFSANAGYWKHIFWMPDVPVPIKILLMPIELAGIFIKPITLLIRLFANITAGHIIILSLVSLMFVFGNAGQSVGGSVVGGIVGGSFALALNFLEILVAFLQAYLFCMLASLYIGSAIEDHHGEHEHDHGH